jgi:hypothetical protein
MAASRLSRGPVRTASLTAIAAVVLGASVAPLRIIAGMHRPPHAKVAEHLARLREVTMATRPDDTILDGFSGLGVFRPHAYFHFFLHDEVRALLGRAGATRLLAALRDGVVAPDWVVADADVLALPSDVVAFLRDNYEPAGGAPLWRLKDLWLDGGRWLDLGGAPTDVLAGRGWQGAEREGERTFRHGRGRRSSLRLPVRRPALCRGIVLRARTGLATAAIVDLAMNGRSIGSVRVSPGWRDHAVPLPRALLRRGVNSLQLSYDHAPGEVETAARGRDPLVAVDGLGLDCGPSRR